MPVPCKSGQFITMAQAHSLLRQAGFPENDIVTMGAVMKGESSLCPLAYNKSGETSIGLLQINMDAHGTAYGTEQQLYNPITNVRAGYAIYRKQGKKAWGAFTHPRNNPRYLAFMPESQRAYGQPSNPVVLNTSQVMAMVNSSNVPAAVIETEQKPDYAMYIALGLLGVVMLRGI